MSKEVVDVLIIGAGAAGAAMAWGLADTRMRIVCLEQGELMNPLAYPITGRDWEARALSDMVTNPTVRGLPGDCPINEADSLLQWGRWWNRFSTPDISRAFIPATFA